MPDNVLGFPTTPEGAYRLWLRGTQAECSWYHAVMVIVCCGVFGASFIIPLPHLSETWHYLIMVSLVTTLTSGGMRIFRPFVRATRGYIYLEWYSMIIMPLAWSSALIMSF